MGFKTNFIQMNFSYFLCPSDCRVKGLPTKKKYRFRVLAENLAGPGKPSAETDPVLIKDPIGMSFGTIRLTKIQDPTESWIGTIYHD